MSASSFFADAVLFDMDGTLTDSIAAVEAAWGKVAADIGQDPAYVIAATHGKRAIDNLARFKPHLQAHEIETEVDAFEKTILYYADAYAACRSLQSHTPSSKSSPFVPSSGFITPSLSNGSSTPSPQPSDSDVFFDVSLDSQPSFGTRLSDMLTHTIVSTPSIEIVNDPVVEEAQQDLCPKAAYASKQQLAQDVVAAWEEEAASVDRSVRILPSVREMIASIPEGRYAVATSGARTYAYGCMTRVGITPPKVTITADDKRLEAGKPAPDPFLLAAACLGYKASDCVVFEDSPSGIRSGVASGATVIAVCTSHERTKIENCGAHYVVDDMSKVTCEAIGNGASTKLKFTVRC